MKIKLILNKFFICITIIFLLIYFIITFLIFNKSTFDSKEFIENKIASKKVLEAFLNYHMDKKDVKYTKNIIKHLIADKDNYKESLVKDLSLELSEKSIYTISVLKVSKNEIYYVLEIPTKHPSEADSDFIFTYYFKLIKKKNNWIIEKICVICDITKL